MTSADTKVGGGLLYEVDGRSNVCTQPSAGCLGSPRTNLTNFRMVDHDEEVSGTSHRELASLI